MASGMAQCPSCRGQLSLDKFYARACCLDMPRVSVCETCSYGPFFKCLYCFKEPQKVREYLPVPIGFEGTREYGVNPFYGVFTGGGGGLTDQLYGGTPVLYAALEACLSGYAKRYRMMRDEQQSLHERNRQLTVLTTSLTNRYYTVVNQGASVQNRLEQCLAENAELRARLSKLEERDICYHQSIKALDERIAALENSMLSSDNALQSLDNRIAALNGSKRKRSRKMHQ